LIGIILLLISWILLRFEGKPLAVLGFDKPAQRGIELAAGISIAALFAVTQQFLHASFAGFQWVQNPQFGVATALEGLRWNLNSVLFEEFIFRGYLLYKAITWLGVRKACLLSAAAFGVYHWFSYGLFGSLVPMLFIFFFTGTFGLMLAYAFAKSKSIFLPIALHFGWNVTQILVFSNGPIGAQWLVGQPEDLVGKLQGFPALFTNICLPLALPLLVLLLLKYRLYKSPSSTTSSVFNDVSGRKPQSGGSAT